MYFSKNIYLSFSSRKQNKLIKKTKSDVLLIGVNNVELKHLYGNCLTVTLLNDRFTAQPTQLLLRNLILWQKYLGTHRDF